MTERTPQGSQSELTGNIPTEVPNIADLLAGTTPPAEAATAVSAEQVTPASPSPLAPDKSQRLEELRAKSFRRTPDEQFELRQLERKILQGPSAVKEETPVTPAVTEEPAAISPAKPAAPAEETQTTGEAETPLPSEAAGQPRRPSLLDRMERPPETGLKARIERSQQPKPRPQVETPPAVTPAQPKTDIRASLGKHDSGLAERIRTQQRKASVPAEPTTPTQEAAKPHPVDPRTKSDAQIKREIEKMFNQELLPSSQPMDVLSAIEDRAKKKEEPLNPAQKDLLYKQILRALDYVRTSAAPAEAPEAPQQTTTSDLLSQMRKETAETRRQRPAADEDDVPAFLKGYEPAPAATPPAEPAQSEVDAQFTRILKARGNEFAPDVLPPRYQQDRPPWLRNLVPAKQVKVAARQPQPTGSLIGRLEGAQPNTLQTRLEKGAQRAAAAGSTPTETPPLADITITPEDMEETPRGLMYREELPTEEVSRAELSAEPTAEVTRGLGPWLHSLPKRAKAALGRFSDQQKQEGRALLDRVRTQGPEVLRDVVNELGSRRMEIYTGAAFVSSAVLAIVDPKLAGEIFAYLPLARTAAGLGAVALGSGALEAVIKNGEKPRFRKAAAIALRIARKTATYALIGTTAASLGNLAGQHAPDVYQGIASELSHIDLSQVELPRVELPHIDLPQLVPAEGEHTPPAATETALQSPVAEATTAPTPPLEHATVTPAATAEPTHPPATATATPLPTEQVTPTPQATLEATVPVPAAPTAEHPSVSDLARTYGEAHKILQQPPSPSAPPPPEGGPPPVVSEATAPQVTPPAAPETIITAHAHVSGHEISGSVLGHTLTYDSQPWSLADNGYIHIHDLLSTNANAMGIDGDTLERQLQQAVDLWSKGQLTQNSQPDLWRLFHLSNGTASVSSIVNTPETITSLTNLGVIK